MLSVIIPTRNRSSVLRNALSSLRAQTLPASEFEIIVVDNGSTDDTQATVKDFSGSLPLRYFFEPMPGLHAGRHLGMRESQGEVLVYADDDIEAEATWLSAIRDCFVDPDVVLVGGNNYPKFDAAPPSWLRKLWARPALGGHAISWLSVLELPPGRRAIDPYCVWGCNFSIRKSSLLEAGGFHPDGMPDELIRFRGDGETHVAEHIVRTGGKTIFDSDASVHHSVSGPRMTLEYFRKRAFNQGVSDSYSRLRRDGIAGKRGRARVALGTLAAFVAGCGRRARTLLGDGELRMLDQLIRRGYREGFAYHQRVYREDAEVREWVHRPDYF